MPRSGVFWQTIAEHGPDMRRFYILRAVLTAEELLRFHKLARALVATNNIDSKLALCMSSAGGRLQAQSGCRCPALLVRRH